EGRRRPGRLDRAGEPARARTRRIEVAARRALDERPLAVEYFEDAVGVAIYYRHAAVKVERLLEARVASHRNHSYFIPSERSASGSATLPFPWRCDSRRPISTSIASRTRRPLTRGSLACSMQW